MLSRVSHFFKYRFPAVAWAGMIALASSIPAEKLPETILLDYDKLVHVGIFFIFGFLVYRALEPYTVRRSFSWKRVSIAIIVVVAYGIIDEFHQGSVPGRTLDVYDILADTVGGILAGMLMFFLNHRRQKTKTAMGAS